MRIRNLVVYVCLRSKVKEAVVGKETEQVAAA